MKKYFVIRGNRYDVKDSTRKDKDYMIELKNGKKVHFGDPNSTLKSHINKNKKSYCARSSRIKSSSAYSPNSLSRRMWKC